MGLRIAVDQENFVFGGRECPEQKHPEMRHEVTRDPVIRVVKQYSHQLVSNETPLTRADQDRLRFQGLCFSSDVKAQTRT
jgi:hypothetical protein